MSPVVLAAGALLIGLHFVLHVAFGWGAGAPDLATLGVLAIARETRMGTGAGVGFVVGLLEDALSVLSFGASTVALTIVGAVGSRTRDLFVGESMAFVALYLFVGKWSRDLIQWIMTGPELREPFERALLLDSVRAALYLAVVGLVLVRLFGNWMESRPTRSRGGSI